MSKKFRFKLKPLEIERLESIIKKGSSGARVIRRAHTLLFSHRGKSVEAIAYLLKCSKTTVQTTRQKYRSEGLESVLKEKKRSGRPPKLEGKPKAHLIALACTTPPEGRSYWTMQLLADRLVSLELVESISDETVRRTLKKTLSSHGKSKAGVFPRLIMNL
jgi:transposase